MPSPAAGGGYSYLEPAAVADRRWDAPGSDREVDMERAAPLGVLGDPVRRAMVERLIEQPSSVGRLAKGFPVTRTAISQHLKVLLEAGVVAYRKRGPLNIYQVNPEPLMRLEKYVIELSRRAKGTAQALRRGELGLETA